MMKKLLPKLLLILLLCVNIVASGVGVSTNNVKTSDAPLQAVTPKIYVDPQNGTATVGGFYTITVKIADVTDLYGFDIQIRWGTAVLKYISHTVTVGEAGGVLNPPVYYLMDRVDENSSIENAVPGTTYWIAYASGGGAPSFNGSGSVFTMTFEVLRDGECDVYFTKTEMADRSARLIYHDVGDGYFYKPGLGRVPIANFTFFPDTAVRTRNTLFNASSSYDPDGGNIALYIWNFKDGTIVNTTASVIYHNFTSIPLLKYYDVELTVLDSQGGGSQSKPRIEQVYVVQPYPVAEFTVWPEDFIAALNKGTVFNASSSYDPDPGGHVVEYRWNFGDGNQTTIATPIIVHKFLNIGNYIVSLTVVDDTDPSLQSIPKTHQVEVVERRDIEATSLVLFPDTVKQGEEVAINVTITNKGQADEDFNITAYYESFTIGELSVLAFPKQYTPILEFIPLTSFNNTLNNVLRDAATGAGGLKNETKIMVGTDTGYWTINPGQSNTLSASLGLIPGTPLGTGGWIWEQTLGPKRLNGEFSAGNWSFQTRLLANTTGVNAIVWVRIIKSSNPNPQAAGASVVTVQDWAPIFPAQLLPTSVAIFKGNVSVPSFTLTDEYLYFEFQLQVTDNTSGGAAVTFQVGGPTGGEKAMIEGTAFGPQNRYAILWNTEFAAIGTHTVIVETSEVPQDANTTNNVVSGSVRIESRPSVEPLEITIDAGSIYFGGEIAEFHILVASSGQRTDATIVAFIVFKGTMTQLDATQIEPIDTGIYSINYQVPVDAQAGTYTLLVEASRDIEELNTTQRGASLRSFLLSQTFSDWDSEFNDFNAMLLEIEGNTTTILTGIGEIKVNLNAINATLAGLVRTSKGEVLAKIDTALGPISARLDTINATVTDINGNTLTINSTLGETRSSLDAFSSTMTIGLIVASVFSAVAAIVAILVLLRVRKPSK